MGHQEASMGLALILAATVLWAWAEAQSNDCSTALVSLSPCLNYITGNSSTPATACCSQLSTVVVSQPDCLCQVLNGGGSSLGLTINQTQALALPRACNVQTPPTSRCNAASPTGSTTPTPPNTVPINDGDRASDANSNSLGASMILFSTLIFFLATSTMS